MQSAEKGEAAGKLLEPGDMFGDYTVEKLLGRGGMGAVYLVRAPDGERYAVKLMFPEIASKNPDFRKRFAREAEFAMKIKHKNLISVYDVGEDPDTGFCYIIMDYVPGGSVKDRIAAKGALPIAEAVSIAVQIALALEVAHRHGVVHRDIKPDNIMFDADGTPKLADLGVAKFTDDEHKTTVTTTGMIIGTPAYMAPEQMMDSHHIDARADIYALGVVLYEMLTGKRPTEGSSAVELLAKALRGEALPDVRTMRPEISAAIAHVLSLMCAPKPAERPPTTLAVAQLLQQAATGQLKLPQKRPRAADAQKAKRPFPVAACVMGALILGTALFGWRAWSSRQDPTTGATGVPHVAAATSTAIPPGTTGVSPVGVGASGTPRPAAVRRSGTLAASEKPPHALYCVVDLSAGPNAEKYPVSYLNAEPKDGWPDEYKKSKLVLRRIEPGSFKMGGKYDVTLTKAYYIGVFEVTQRQYELVVGTNPSRFKGDMRPVEKMSYELLRGKDEGAKWPVSSAVDSSSFMGKIRARTGIDSFDLPTEAQWEYACLAGTPNKYNDGSDSGDDLKELGRFAFNQKLPGWKESDADLAKHKPDGKGGCSEAHTVVGSYLPNAWGLYDMRGNVFEWCLDWHGNLSDGKMDPVGAFSGTGRVVRGNCWNSGANSLDSSGRVRLSPSYGGSSHGFRLAVSTDIFKDRRVAPSVPNVNGRDARPPSKNGQDVTPSSAGGIPDTSNKVQGFPETLYCVVDLSAGPNAKKYPVSYLNAEPNGGWTDEYKTTKLVLRRIEPGSFKMGGKYDVTITKAFYIGVFEVTQRQYELVTGDNPSEFKGIMRPVEKVSYDMIRGKDAGARWPASSAVDSSSFTGRLRARTGIDGFDLPTAAQWEYACRARTASAYNNGGDSEDDLKEIGRFALNQKRRGWNESDTELARHVPDGKGGYLEGPAVVGSYLPNAWGLYDMHGNIWEWCLDWRGNLSSGVMDPVGSSSESRRVLRGGSWGDRAERCASFCRDCGSPSRKNGYNGFRLAISPDLLKEQGITPPVSEMNGRDARPPSANGQDVRSPSIEPFKLLSERPQPLTIKLGKGEQLELMGCPAGTFTMGHEGCGPIHTPHQVTISRPFWAGKYPVTRAQWDLFMPPRKLDEIEIALGGPKGAVSLVRRKEIDEYCNLLTKRYRSLLPKGYVFRLPTIAEAEYFWRTDSQDANDPYAKSQKLTEEERVAIAVGDEGKKELLKRKGVAWKDMFSIPSRTPSVEVGLRRSNAWGLYDLAGNVDQWMLDVFPSARETKVARVQDLSWSDVTDPLFWSAEGLDGAVIYLESRNRKNWTELSLFCGASRLRWRSLGFRVVAGPDLVSERNGKGLAGSAAEQGGARSIEVFPHADAQNAKWKKRAPWRYTVKVPPANWMEPGFRDGMWKRTNKPLGFGKDASFMRIAEKWNTSDVWLRRHFTWKKTEKVTDVMFDMLHDGDVEIYLNGTRILEEKGTNTGWEPFSVSVETFMSAVKDGDNVLAVKVHDGAAPRCFDCGLTVQTEEVK